MVLNAGAIEAIAAAGGLIVTAGTAYWGARKGHKKEAEAAAKASIDGAVKAALNAKETNDWAKSVDNGLTEIRGHLKRQDEHMARQDKTNEQTLLLQKEHKEAFAKHVDDDERRLGNIDDAIKNIGQKGK